MYNQTAIKVDTEKIASIASSLICLSMIMYVEIFKIDVIIYRVDSCGYV